MSVHGSGEAPPTLPGSASKPTTMVCTHGMFSRTDRSTTFSLSFRSSSIHALAAMRSMRCLAKTLLSGTLASMKVSTSFDHWRPSASMPTTRTDPGQLPMNLPDTIRGRPEYKSGIGNG